MRVLAVAVLLAFVCGECVAQQPAEPPRSTASAPANGVAGASRKLTLKEAEALALRNNPQITIGKLRSLEAQQYVREARSALLPTAYLSLTAVDSDPGGRITAGGLTNPTVFPRAGGDRDHVESQEETDAT